jgi:hypothetical protein
MPHERTDAMKARWIALTALLVVIVGGITAAIIWDKPGDWPDRRDRVEVVRVVNDDGTTATIDDTGSTVVLVRDRGFFPFGILFVPLGFLFFFLLFRTIFRGPGGCGPRRGGPSPAWLDEWHRQQHQASVSAAPASEPQD